MSDRTLYFGGMTTDPEVKRLRESFPPATLSPDSTVSYARISEVIGVPHEAHRWKTIVGRWRKIIEKEDNVMLLAQAGKECFVVATNRDRLHCGIEQMGHAKRRIGRAMVRVARVDFEEGPERDKAEHFKMHASMVVNQLSVARRALPAPKAVDQSARRELPADAKNTKKTG